MEQFDKKDAGTSSSKWRVKWNAKWLFVFLCIAALAAGGVYLSITRLAPLGGDDCINNLWKYDTVTHQTLWETLKMNFEEIGRALTLRSDRFFPFYFPLRSLCWFLYGTIDSYRMYIIACTLVTAAVLGCVLYRTTGSRNAGLAFLALLPLMLCLWSRHSENAMYSYEALPQITLLPALISMLCTVNWSKNRHLRWAIAAWFFMFFSCGTYEIGYVFLAAIGFFCLMLHDKFWDAVKTGIPALLGALTALAFWVGSNLLASRNGGVYAGFKMNLDLQEVGLTWLRQMSAAFPLNPLLLGGAAVSQVKPQDVLLPLILAGITVYAIVSNTQRLSGKQLALVFCAGLSILMFPALLLALTEKYQSDAWISWTHGYISHTVESFGVGLMLLVLLILVFQRFCRTGVRRIVFIVAAVLLLTSMGAFQRAATRENYEGTRTAYDLRVDSVEQGLLDEVPDNAILLGNTMVWGESHEAQEWFVKRYADRKLTAGYGPFWTEPKDPAAPIWLMHLWEDGQGHAIVWVGEAVDDASTLVRNPKIFIDETLAPANAMLRYTRVADGVLEDCMIPLDEMEHFGGEQQYFVFLQEEQIAEYSLSLVG